MFSKYLYLADQPFQDKRSEQIINPCSVYSLLWSCIWSKQIYLIYNNMINKILIKKYCVDEWRERGEFETFLNIQFIQLFRVWNNIAKWTELICF